MVLEDDKSQMKVAHSVLEKKKYTRTINRWIREYIQKDKNKEIYPIKVTYEELKTSRNSYYKWTKRKSIKNRYILNHESLKPLIKNIMIYQMEILDIDKLEINCSHD